VRIPQSFKYDWHTQLDTTRASLLLRVRNPSDNAAWSQFDEIYRPMLHRFGRTAGLNETDAEDVVQQCMISISEHIRSFDYDPSIGRFKGWLRTLVNNRIRSIRRARPINLAKTGDFQKAQEREPLPEDAFEELWRQQHLRHALFQIRDEVEDSSFEAYRRYVMNGEPVSAVCEALHLNRNQLYAIKFRITRKLHARVKDLLDD
jgi:RNA polymerase sigma factor (sigma-70 family)